MGIVWVIIAVGVPAAIVATAAALRAGGLAAGSSRRGATGAAAGFAALWLAWLVASALIAAAGGYRGPLAVGGAVLGAFAAALLLAQLPPMARILRAPDTPARMAWPQALRVIGGVFLIVLAIGDLPAIFALPAGLGDIAVGVAAPLVARRRSPAGLAAFNLLGLLDLVVAVSIGALASRVLGGTPDTRLLGQLPLALIPTVAVPLVAALHAVSLARLRAASQPGRERGMATATS